MNETNFFDKTFDDIDWLKANENQLRRLLPKQPKVADGVFFMGLAFGLKVMGVMWTDMEEDIPAVLSRLHLLDILRSDITTRVQDPIGSAVWVNPDKVSQVKWILIQAWLTQVKRDHLDNTRKAEAMADELFERLKKST